MQSAGGGLFQADGVDDLAAESPADLAQGGVAGLMDDAGDLVGEVDVGGDDAGNIGEGVFQHHRATRGVQAVDGEVIGRDRVPRRLRNRFRRRSDGDGKQNQNENSDKHVATSIHRHLADGK